MQEHELWVTVLFNDYLAGLGNSVLSLVRFEAQNPARPWANFITMQIVTAIVIVVVFGILRTRLSMDRPNKMQHIFEVFYNFLHQESEDNAGHEGPKYLAYFVTVFFFVLFSNLLGIVPGFESPTMFPYVPCGIALATFCYYNLMGIQAHGAAGYFKHFMGPMPLLAPLMIPIEIFSHLARPLSLTIRLFANMFAGEQVTLVFLSMTYFLIPAVFMGLHVFVSFMQAYVFALLSMVYVGTAVAHEH